MFSNVTSTRHYLIQVEFVAECYRNVDAMNNIQQIYIYLVTSDRNCLRMLPNVTVLKNVARQKGATVANTIAKKKT